MQPVEQEYLLDAPQGGDCFRACVASVFELPLESVPHFCADRIKEVHLEIDGWYSQPWVTAVSAWAWMLGYNVQMYGESGLWDWEDIAFGAVIAGGPSPRDPDDTLHAVVYGPDGLMHDPHPSNDGLAGDPVDFTVFIERDDKV